MERVKEGKAAVEGRVQPVPIIPTKNTRSSRVSSVVLDALVFHAKWMRDVVRPLPCSWPVQDSQASGTAFYFLLGLFICGFIAILPEMLPALHSKDGFVWTPLNSQNYRVGDAYYYAPWLREILAGSWPLGQPTAAGHGNVSIDAVRLAPFALGAWPGLVFSDFRWVVAIDISFSALLTFCIIYGIATAFGGRPSSAFAAGIIGLFLNGVWASIPPSAEFLAVFRLPPGAANWAQVVSAETIAAFGRLFNPPEYDLAGDLFRFVNLSLSAPLLFAHFYAAVLLRRRPVLVRGCLLLALSCAIAFSYPSHPIAAYLILMGFAADGIVRRDWRCMISFGGVGVATISFLLIVGYPRLVGEAYRSSVMMNAVYFSGPVGLRAIGIGDLFYTFVLSKYTLSVPLVAAMLRRSPVALSAALVVGGVAVAFSSVVLLDPTTLWQRFLARGIDPLWWVIVAIGLTQACVEFAAYLKGGVRRDAVVNVMATAGLVGLVAVPLIGFGRFAQRNVAGLAHYMPIEQWETYRWIWHNLPRNAEVAALDWNDIDLLPIFTDVNLVFGHTDLAGTTSGEQARRYMAVWKFAGLPRDELRRILIDSIPASRGRVDWAHLDAVPFSSPSAYEASQFAEAVVYWPYLNDVEGVKFAQPDGLSVNPAFVDSLMKTYDELPDNALPNNIRCDYLLVDIAARKDLRLPPGAEIVFRNSSRALYRLAPMPVGPP